MRKAVREWEEGNDIDLYLLLPTGVYARFALQAKVLSPPTSNPIPSTGPAPAIHSKRYHGIEKPRGKRGYQWNMLTKWEKANSKKPGVFRAYYLLYNGFSYNQFSSCGLHKTALSSPHYGCSLVRPLVVEKLTRSKRPKKGRKHARKAPTYEAFHTLAKPLAKPWHSLVCDSKMLSKYKAKLYTYAEIMNDKNFLTIQQQQQASTQAKERGVDIPALSDEDVEPGSIPGFGPNYQIIIDLEHNQNGVVC